MPANLTYPGVYIEEISSGVRTITGVATSITAFIGRAERGPVDEPITINSYGDFERTFGGLWAESRLGYAVRDFFTNGGNKAVIVRLYSPSDNSDGHARLDANGLTLMAISPGVWGNNLRARVVKPNQKVLDQLVENYPDLEPKKDKIFTLIVRDGAPGGVTETFQNVVVEKGHRRDVTEIVKNESRLIQVETGATAPSPHDLDLTNEERNEGKKTVWDSDNTSCGSDNKGVDGETLTSNDFIGDRKDTEKKGLYALKKVDLFNLLYIPPYQDIMDEHGGDIESELIAKAEAFCVERRAMLLLDSPSKWIDKDEARKGMLETGAPTTSKNAAIFFPRLKQPNPKRDNQIEEFGACGVVAGVFARTDVLRGVWKAPAGVDDGVLRGVPELSVNLTDEENGELNPLGLNCLRAFPTYGRVIWGSRTANGADAIASEWKYIPVRRTALFIEESLYRGTKWVVFEPNDERTWAAIRLNVGAFMHDLFRKGAFQRKTSNARDSYFVKCDAETTTQTDINLGIVNIVVGFAPLKPIEFVVLKIQQIAGDIQT